MYNFAKASAKVFLALSFRVKVCGKENIPQSGALILCPNHRSVIDPMFVSCNISRQVFYMAKQELFTEHGALFKKLLYSLGAFPVTRQSADKDAVNLAAEHLENGRIVGIFPQGKISHGEKDFDIKAGAAMLALKTGTNILPVSIYFEGKLKPFKKVTVRFGKIIPVKQAEKGVAGKSRQLAKVLSNTVVSQLEEEHCI